MSAADGIPCNPRQVKEKQKLEDNQNNTSKKPKVISRSLLAKTNIKIKYYNPSSSRRIKQT